MTTTTTYKASFNITARGAYALGKVQGACSEIVRLIEVGTLKVRFEAKPTPIVKAGLLGIKVVGASYAIEVQGRDKRHVDACVAALRAQTTR